MHRSFRRALVFSVVFLTVLAAALPVFAFRDPELRGRFQELLLPDPGQVIGIRTYEVSELDAGDALRDAWEGFRAERQGTWRVWLDDRSGLPSLAYGNGIAWVPGRGNELPMEGVVTIDTLEALAREFIERQPAILGTWGGQLVLDREASGLIRDQIWLVVFRQEIDGVRVDEARYDFHVSHGNLVSFGATRWGAVDLDPVPTVDRDAALDSLRRYLDLQGFDEADWKDTGSLSIIPMDPSGDAGSAWAGARGLGYEHSLAWRFAWMYGDEPETWVGKVDAHTGQVISFADETHYARVKGGVYPLTNDGSGPDAMEQPGFPMPLVDYSEDGGPDAFTGDHGLYECNTLGNDINTNLNGTLVRINDVCGATSETEVCDEEIDLGMAPGIDCNVQPGSSPGNTGAARSCYYHTTRVKEQALFWLPSNTWLNAKLTCRSNVNSTCNATYSGQLNMYRDGGSACRNTGENQGVVVHEWGHGMDSNDGGGGDNPGEGYADVSAILYGRISCVGPGFYKNQTCTGYGDTCLTCTGIREMDWDARESHTPATPANFEDPNCSGGSGPCGSAVHCSSYVPSESIFDLATRDLPASGMDQDTAWQHTEQLWYTSRQGSGGPAYNCSLPNSDGCGTVSWFHKLRVADDDDGNLANGTPNAAAIFAAFDRHAIACGAASDPENQSTSSCPTLAKPALSLTARSNAVDLSWGDVTDAAAYRVLRNDLGCHRAQAGIVDVASPATTYLDDDLANDVDVYYRIQAVGSNPACTSPVSDCLSAAPQPFAGSVRFDQLTYGCSNRIGLQVRDANVGGPTVSVTVWSDTEAAPETVTLTESEPGSAKYVGEIFTTSAAPSADGLLSTTGGDTITAEYVDADDGAGGLNVAVQRTALSDCVFPMIANVGTSGVTDVQATVTWTTDEGSDTVLVWGDTPPPGTVVSRDETVTSHGVTLTGLQACTVYFFQVESTDPAGNTAVSDNNGVFYRFETLGDFGQGLQPCHDGQLTVLSPIVSCAADTFSVEVIDLDLNLDNLTPDTVAITISSSTETNGETVVLTETGANTSIFTGTITTGGGGAVPGDGILQTSHDDVLTATYEDEDEGAGGGGFEFGTGVADCSGASFPSVEVINIGDETAQITFSTSEPTTGSVSWGLTPALSNVVPSVGTGTVHTVDIGSFLECGRVYFSVSATDVHGNTTSSDAGGVPYEFNGSQIAGAVFKDGFETAEWSLDGEWEIDVPQGLGSGASPDPASAFAGSQVLGHDLSGQGANPGDYEPGTNEKATSPSIDTSSLSSVELKIRRWLNLSIGGVAAIEVKQGGSWFQVWADADGAQESSWTYQTVDISAFAAGNADLQVRFGVNPGPGGFVAGGWNVDRFVVRDGSQPEFGACGGCGGAPTFAGLSSAADADGCSGSGVNLAWEPAPSWGTGSGGTYAVYRGTDPAFVPSGANLVAAGISGTAYTDTSAPNDQDLYYVVRAESNETCGAGPSNGGVEDPNLVRLAARDDTSQAVPGSLGDTLRVDGVNRAHVRLSWSPAAGAAAYHVDRSLDATSGYSQIGDVAGLAYEDENQFAEFPSYYYLVHPADSCGNEAP